MAPTEGRVARPERRWGCRRGTHNWWNYFRRIPTYVITIHQRYRDGRTDGQTDRRHAIAIPRCALH